MPVAYNVSGCGIGVASAMRCDTDPSYYSGFDPYWVKTEQFTAANFPHQTLLDRRTQHRNAIRSSTAAGPQRRHMQYVERSISPKRRSVSAMYRPTSFSFQSADKALAGSNRLCQMPVYNPIGDPHLVDYFARKFGVLDEDEPDRIFTSRAGRRPRSARERGTKSARDMTDGSRVKADAKTSYKVTIVTGSQPNAGTSANVFVRLIGSDGKMLKYKPFKVAQKKKSDKQRNQQTQRDKRKPFVFEPSSKHSFTIKHEDLGDLKFLAIKHDGADKQDDWFLSEVIVRNTSIQSRPKWTFPCAKWLSIHQPPDYQASRKLLVADTILKTEYEVTVHTADKSGAGTSANVFITIYGAKKTTPRLQLKGTKHEFDRGQVSSFRLPSVSVGEITKIRLEHDRTGWSPGWCVDKVTLVDLRDPEKKYYAIPNSAGGLNWLDTKMGDKNTFKIISCSTDETKVVHRSKYKITTVTGSVAGAGTDAKVFVNLFGSEGETGEQTLVTSGSSKAFSKGRTDEFVIESAPIGVLQRVRVGHDNKGVAPGWYLETLTVEEVETGIKKEFKVNRWFAKSEDDKLIVRDLYCDDRFKDDVTGGGTPFEISVHTGDVMNAGTDAKIYIIMHGEKKAEDGSKSDVTSGKMFLHGGSFERKKIDLIRVDSLPELSPLTRLTIGHDNSGVGASWYLDKVIVFCPSTGIEQHFLCNAWLSDSMGDKLIERELKEHVSLRAQRKKEIPWNVVVKTRDIAGAGTSAKVYIQIYGEKGKSQECLLTTEKLGSSKHSHTFDAGATDRFKVSLLDVGKLSKLRIWHDNSGPFAGWFLETVVMTNVLKPEERYEFVCNKWLSVDEDYHETVRELPAKGPSIKTHLPIVLYKLKIFTGKKTAAGTDANVFCTLFGERSDSGMRKIRRSGTNINKFESGSVEECVFECVDLGKLTKVRIEHDNSLPGAGWYLDQITVLPMSPDSSAASTEGVTSPIVFPCYRWLAEDEDDGQCVRELYPEGVSPLLNCSQYLINVKTGSAGGAGTDANVFVHMFGEAGDSGKIFLRNSLSFKNKFESGRTDRFSIEGPNIGKIEKIRVGHDDSGVGPGWFLDKMDIEIPMRGEKYVFSAHRWLDRNEMDGKIEVDLYPTETIQTQIKIPYEVTVTTSDMANCGLDSNAMIVIYGSNGLKTDTLVMDNKRGAEFEPGVTSRFRFNGPEIGKIKKIRVWHEGVSEKSSWHLSKIKITRPPITTKDEGGKKLTRENPFDGSITRSKYEKPLANSTQIEGRSSSAVSPQIDRRSSNYSMYDQRKISAAASSTQIEGRESSVSPEVNRRFSKYDQPKMAIESPVKASPIKKAVADQKSFPLVYEFNCNTWLSLEEGSQCTVQEFAPQNAKKELLDSNSYMAQYDVIVKTGLLKDASADVAVSLNVFGTEGDSGFRKLRRLPRDETVRFEAGGDGVHFSIKAVNLGKVTKCVVSLEKKSWDKEWFLDSVEVDVVTKNKGKFFMPCQRWLGRSTKEGQIAWTLVPIPFELVAAKVTSEEPTAVRDTLQLELRSMLTTYTVAVYTGNKQGAGTDAGVYVYLHGELDTSPRFWLKRSQNNKDKFESGNCDTFTCEAKDLGDLKKITIGHTDSGVGSAWYLEFVEVQAYSEGCFWGFPCAKWLAKGEDDGLTERVLEKLDSKCGTFEPWVPYEIVTETSDISGASTDSDIFTVVYGDEACTEQHSLEPSKEARKKRFEKGQKDKFILEMVDVQDIIRKVRIGHANQSSGSGWHLKEMSIRKMLTPPTHCLFYSFTCNRWLDYGKDDRAIVRELIPSAGHKEWVDIATGKLEREDFDMGMQLDTMKKYEIYVYTGKVSGAGTDANVFCTLFGELGDSGERKLAQSATHLDKFEKGHMDQFTIEAVDLGKLFKLKIRHDNSGILGNASWYLDKVEVKDVERNETAVFYAERWLSKDKDKNKHQKIETTLYAKGYEGDKDSASTLTKSFGGSRMSLNSTRFGGSGDPSSPKRRPLREMPLFNGPTVPYTIKVETGGMKDAGTNADAFIVIKGPADKTTGRLPLILLEKEAFEPDCTETFSIQAPDVNDIREITIGHDGVMSSQAWFLKSVEVDMPHQGKNFLFPCNRWLAKDKEDGLLERTISAQDASQSDYKPKRSYDMVVETGDIERAGTDFKIQLQFFGANGSSTPLSLSKQEDTLERGNVDSFPINIEDIAPLKKVRVSVEPAGSRTSWFLEKISLRDKKTGDMYVFNCQDWFDLKRKIVKRELPATVKGEQVIKETTYVVYVKTSDISFAGTNANVSVIMFGENGDSDVLNLTKSKTYFDKFERNHVDEFEFPNMLSLGNLLKLRIWHDNAGVNASWHLYSVEVLDQSTGKRFRFLCNKWLSKSKDDKMTSRDLICDSVGREHESSTEADYEIVVRTTDKQNASTKNHAFVRLVGNRATSKPLYMINKASMRLFKGGDENKFEFRAENVGKIESILIGHLDKVDGQTGVASKNGGVSAEDKKWHCYDVTVTNAATKDKYTFLVNQWLPLMRNAEDGVKVDASNHEVGMVNALKTLTNVKYQIDVFTGNEKGAGTDANVFVHLFGQNGDSGRQKLTKSFRDLFEKGQRDSFTLEFLDLGKLTKLTIEHDNSGLGAAWYLDKVEVTNLTTGNVTVFPCAKWLDKSKGDNLIKRDLLPRSS